MLKITDKTEKTYVNPRDMERGHYYKFDHAILGGKIIGLVIDNTELDSVYCGTNTVPYVDIKTGIVYVEECDNIELVEELDIEMIINLGGK